jgi:hypothetical protein
MDLRGNTHLSAEEAFMSFFAKKKTSKRAEKELAKQTKPRSCPPFLLPAEAEVPLLTYRLDYRTVSYQILGHGAS